MNSNLSGRDYAIELVDKFRPFTKDQADSKECALVALDELREATWGGYDYDAGFELPFYDEIEKVIKSMPTGRLYYMDMKYGKNEPTKFTNDYGDWEIYENGNVIIKPIKAAESITVKFKITPDGVEYE